MSSPAGGAAPSSERPWWSDAVTYQIYVRSFADADGDGIGDLPGIVDRIEHVARLGADAIWLSPCFPSPWRDGGYDVADYFTVDDVYGGDAALQSLLAAAHSRGLRVLLDLVPNHCSVDHPWFAEALASAPGSAARARFHFRDGRGTTGEDPPNNWRSEFGGSAWTRVPDPDGGPGQWYLHSFDTSQADFDWDCDEVREMFDDVLRHWFDRGVDGFRIDVAYAMVKRAGLPDSPDPGGPNPHATNQPGVLDILSRWRAVAEGAAVEPALTGEVWLDAEASRDYVEGGRLTQVFTFDLLGQPWDAAAFGDCLRSSLTVANDVGMAWTLNNHDVHRAVSRYGLVDLDDGLDDSTRRLRPRGVVDVGLGLARARAALLMLLVLPGGIYLYQGEELGLPEVMDMDDDARHDPIWRRTEGREVGRDGCRVPLPWDHASATFGFSPSTATRPAWLPQPPWFADFAVDLQMTDAGSTLALYRRALHLRRQILGRVVGFPAVVDDVTASAITLRRGPLRCVVAFEGPSLTLPAAWGDVVLRSDGGCSRLLPAGTAAWTWAD